MLKNDFIQEDIPSWNLDRMDEPMLVFRYSSVTMYVPSNLLKWILCAKKAYSKSSKNDVWTVYLKRIPFVFKKKKKKKKFKNYIKN
jgi:hypothetical protein